LEGSAVREERRSASASDLSSQRAKREAATMEAERRVMWEARVRRKERSAGVGGMEEGWRVVKVWRAVVREGDVSL
jgi:anti-sigma-K factor RskA